VTPASGPGPASRLARRVLLVLDAVTRAMAYGSGVLFLLVSFYVAGDAVARTFFHASTAVSDEFGGYVLAGLRSDKRALHDLVARTRVVRL